MIIPTSSAIGRLILAALSIPDCVFEVVRALKWIPLLFMYPAGVAPIGRRCEPLRRDVSARREGKDDYITVIYLSREFCNPTFPLPCPFSRQKLLGPSLSWDTWPSLFLES